MQRWLRDALLEGNKDKKGTQGQGESFFQFDAKKKFSFVLSFFFLSFSFLYSRAARHTFSIIANASRGVARVLFHLLGGLAPPPHAGLFGGFVGGVGVVAFHRRRR